MAHADQDSFRSAMRALAGGCTLLSIGEGTERNGMVLTSGVSLSMDPPMMLACIDRRAACYGLMHPGAIFGWTILGKDHQPIAERFAGRTGVRGAARFETGDWHRSASGAMLLQGAPASLACRIEDMIDKATHTILIGAVLEVRLQPGAGALAYLNGRFCPLEDPAPSAPPAS